MSIIEYHNLKYKVSERIDWTTEGRRLLYICKAFLPDGNENNIQDVLSLLDKLEEKNRLAIDSLAVFKDLLKQLGEWNLLQLVKKFENKRKEYKRFLKQSSKVLDECSQLERLISVCEGKISHDRQTHIKNVSTLFTELEKQNHLGIDGLEILKTMAAEVEKPELLEQVEEFENKREQEEDAERDVKRSQAQAAAVLTCVSYAGVSLMGMVTPHCTFRNVAGGVVAVTTWMVLRRSSNLEEFVNTFTEAVLPLGNTLLAISEGSLCFTVLAATSSALEALWKRYQDGTLQKNLQEFLITEDIKQLAGSEVMLTVEIDEEEYYDAVWNLTTAETCVNTEEFPEDDPSFQNPSGYYRGRSKEEDLAGLELAMSLPNPPTESEDLGVSRKKSGHSKEFNSKAVPDMEKLALSLPEPPPPRECEEYKRLSELDLNTKDKVRKLLLSSNTWRKVASKFNMSSAEIDAIETSSSDPGRDVMEFLEVTKPDLEVYDFCKMLRELEPDIDTDIIKELFEHLSMSAPGRS